MDSNNDKKINFQEDILNFIKKMQETSEWKQVNKEIYELSESLANNKFLIEFSRSIFKNKNDKNTELVRFVPVIETEIDKINYKTCLLLYHGLGPDFESKYLTYKILADTNNIKFHVGYIDWILKMEIDEFYVIKNISPNCLVVVEYYLHYIKFIFDNTLN